MNPPGQTDVERKNAEALLQKERLFSETIFASVPGVLYLINQQGRYLRWSKSLETVSGYSAEEIARIHPLDFFADGVKPLIAARIDEVFAKGESSVEAEFLTKSGGTVPFFFTGRRVQFDGQLCLVGMGIDITERKEAEAALLASEARFRMLIEKAPLAISISRLTTTVYVNQKYCEMYGFASAEEVIGEPVVNRLAPEYREEIAERAVKRAHDEPVPSEYECVGMRKDGSTFPLNITVARVELSDGPASLAILTDITERRQAQIRREESERKYRELVELANSIILRWNSQGEVTFINEFGQRFFGFNAAEIVGHHVVGTIVPYTESGGRDLHLLMEQICADPAAFEQNINENICRDGRRVTIAWTNRIVSDAQGKVAEILSVGTDITARQQAEAAVRELNATLERRVVERTEELHAALVRAEAADRIKSSFLATMSHELRTPLNSIIGFTGIILQGLAGPLNEEQTKQLGMVRGSARHLLELINDVLDISKIEAGQIEVRAEPFRLRESLERVAASVTPQAQKKGLALVLIEPPQLGEISSDRRRVEQILLNLLNNAIKFTERGTVTLTASLMEGFRPPSGAIPCAAVRLGVKDTGIGIKPEDMTTLFQPFRQIDSGLTRQHEGTGLGLAICRRIATLLDGEISVTSEWTKGSTFSLILPVRKSP